MAGEALARDILRAIGRMRVTWSLSQSLLLLDLSTGEVVDCGGHRPRGREEADREVGNA